MIQTTYHPTASILLSHWHTEIADPGVLNCWPWRDWRVPSLSPFPLNWLRPSAIDRHAQDFMELSIEKPSSLRPGLQFL